MCCILSGLTWQEAIDQCPPGIVPACHNTDDSVTISGPADDVERFVEELKRKDTFARVIRSAWKAFHCYLMNEVAATMKFALEKVVAIALFISICVILQKEFCTHVFMGGPGGNRGPEAWKSWNRPLSEAFRPLGSCGLLRDVRMTLCDGISRSVYGDHILTHISLASFLWDIGKQCKMRPDAAKCGV